MEVDAPDLAGLYRRFAAIEAHGSSPTYERLCLAVADDDRVLALLAALPRGKRQPNLVFGVLRLLGADVAEPAAALAFAVEHRDRVVAEMLARGTQTNEPARCAVLLPALAAVAGPIALLEVGASAGLCLLYDAYSYAYRIETGEHRLGSGPVTLPCGVAGPVALPTAVPAIAARLGLDPNPLDVTDADTRHWLQCLVWPEHTERSTRLTAALELAADLAPTVVPVIAPDDLPGAVDRLRAAAPDATVVVTHSATAAYLDAAGRRRIAQTCRDLGVRRIGLEGAQVTVDLGADVPEGDWGGRFLLTLDEVVLAHADPHGRDLVGLRSPRGQASLS